MGRRAGLFFLLSDHVHVGHNVAFVAEVIDTLSGTTDECIAEDIHDVSRERGARQSTNEVARRVYCEQYLCWQGEIPCSRAVTAGDKPDKDAAICPHQVGERIGGRQRREVAKAAAR